MARRLLLLCLLLVTTGSPASDPDELVVIHLKHRNAEELLPLLHPLLGPRGSLSGERDHLVLRDRPERIQQLRDVIRHLDMARRDLWVQARSPAGSPPTGDHVRRQYSTDTERGHSIRLRVREGEQAVLGFGVTRESIDYLVGLAHGGPWLEPQLRVSGVRREYTVTAAILGDKADVALTPVFTYITDRGDRRVEFSEFSTRTRIPLGHWTSVALVERDDAGSTQRTVRRYGTRSEAVFAIEVRVDPVAWNSSPEN